MKTLACIALLTLSSFAMAESAWDFDSCMENVMRQFTCQIGRQNVSIDLESASTKLSFKAASDETIYGLFIENVAGGKLYVSCDDSDSLENVLFESQGSSQAVRCKAE